MAELNGMTTEDLIAKTRDFESEVRKTKTQITRIQNDIKNLDARVKENKDKLNLSI